MKVLDIRFIISFAILLIAWAFTYQEALVAMEHIWSKSDTFAHGYFILPISIWLIWRDKNYLLASTTKASWLALPLLLVSLFVGLFAFAADINVLTQLSAVCSFIFIVWLLIGNKLAWHYKFPLAYLLFAVPMGENLIPWLQDVTAWFTVFFLKLNGIPVYVDGLYIQVPTGMFEVAVACSGIRYLIASAAVGALYGYLTYNKIHKQIIFFIFALTLPILANGIRAYGIVAIAYYSDMKYATGVDHLVYGWLFFGFIIMLMFWLGGFFADKEKSVTIDSEEQGQPDSNNKLLPKLLAPIVAVTLLVISGVILTSITVIVKPDTPKPALALQGTFKPVINSNWGITYLDGLSRSHLINKQGTEVFAAAYGNKQNIGEMISFDNKLHNHDAWTIVGQKELTIDADTVAIVHLRNINGSSRSYLYQYKVGQYNGISTNKIKVVQSFNSLFQLAEQGQLVAVSVINNPNLEQVEQKLLDVFKQVQGMEY